MRQGRPILIPCLLWFAAVALSGALVQGQSCPTFKGKLITVEHDVSGTLSIKSDCTLEIPDFTYDGKAPSVYVWGGEECTPGSIARGGRISNTEIPETRFSNKNFKVSLRPQVDFENIGCISIYCEQFSADLGHVETKFDAKPKPVPEPVPEPEPEPELEPEPEPELEPEPEPVPEPVPEPQPQPQPQPQNQTTPTVEELNEEEISDTGDGIYGLENCQVLRKDYLNVHWTLDDRTVKMALEGRPGSGDKWMAFGYSGKDSFGSIMVGSNVVVAGFVNGECFAQDFYLSAYEQCDFLTGNGVCPEIYSNGSTSADLSIPDLAIECNRNGSYMSVYFERPLGATWPTDGSSSAVYAMGPVSPESNANMPVVLYHALALPGSGSSSPVPFNSPKGERLLVALDQEQNTCSNLQGLSDDVGATSSPVNVPVISGTEEFIVTSGEYTVHPDPPGWGLAYIINDQALPVLNVVRGKTYTFKIMAGPTHPLYFTSSSVGAGVLTDYENEVVYGGNDTTFGTEDEPYILTWTPDDGTPDILYYQCAVHQKLGWQIHVFDTEEESNENAAKMDGFAPVSTETDLVTSIDDEGACTMDMGGEILYFQQCDSISEVSGFTYAWNISSYRDNQSFTELTLALRAPLAAGRYVSLGFPQERDTMIGSSAMVMARTGDEVTILPYYLGSQNQEGVTQSSQNIAIIDSMSFKEGELASSYFAVKLPIPFTSTSPGILTETRRLMQASLSLEDFNFLWSSGAVTSEGNPAYHGGSKGSIYVNLESGLAETTVNLQTINMSARRAHMWLMAIGWGLFIPIGIVGARMKHTILPTDANVSWFQVHRAVQTLGYVMGLAGIGCGFAVRGEWDTPFTIHRDLGVTITTLGAVQIISIVARPSPDSKSRRYWGYWHRWIGRATSILAISNIYYGMFDVADVDTWAWVVYTILLAVIVAIGLFNDAYRVLNQRNRGTTNTKDDPEKGKETVEIVKPVDT